MTQELVFAIGALFFTTSAIILNHFLMNKSKDRSKGEDNEPRY
jgi:hypothetical protein